MSLPSCMMVALRANGVAVSVIVIATLIGIALYVVGLIVSLAVGVARGQIDPNDIDEVARGWGNIDSDVHDGEWGTRDSDVWCEWCHRYHPG